MSTSEQSGSRKSGGQFLRGKTYTRILPSRRSLAFSAFLSSFGVFICALISARIFPETSLVVAALTAVAYLARVRALGRLDIGSYGEHLNPVPRKESKQFFYSFLIISGALILPLLALLFLPYSFLGGVAYAMVTPLPLSNLIFAHRIRGLERSNGFILYKVTETEELAGEVFVTRVGYLVKSGSGETSPDTGFSEPTKPG
jgi:hypothetical protein